LKDLDQALREAQNRWIRVQKARSSMPNNTGEFAARVDALRKRLDAAQVRLANVAKQQNGLLESLARNELEQQKERIGTYQIQARFALASIYDRAALGGGTVKAPPDGKATESQGETERVPQDPAAPTDQPTADQPAADQPATDQPATDHPAPPAGPPPATDPASSGPGSIDPGSIDPGVNTSAPPAEPPK